MPQRPRSHQLEDISIHRFRAAMPAAWVVRERSRDYGIDLEVEIFTSEGLSTGLLFYVQLRATDDISRSKFTRFKADQVEYFGTLDVPTAIVRYSSQDDKLYLKWGFELDARAIETQSVTVNFRDGDLLDSESPDLIFQTLETLRNFRSLEAFAPVRLEIVNVPEDTQKAYDLQVAYEQLSRLISSGKTSRVEDAGGFTIQIAADSDLLTVGIGRIAKIEVVRDTRSQATLLADLSYSVVLLLWRLRLRLPAQRIARRLAGHVDPPSPNSGLTAALALLPDAKAAVDIACRAGVHEKQDENFFLLVAAMQTFVGAADHLDARLLLNVRAIESGCYDVDPISKAALHYSTANILRSINRFGQAVAHYKKALRLRPEYCRAPYFARELGGCLYMRRKFGSASMAYDIAYALDPSPSVAILSADAKMCVGEFDRAAELFDLAEVESSVLTPGEAALKAELCRRLAAQHGSSVIRPISQLGPLWKSGENDGDWKAVLAADPLDPLGNFNFGLSLAEAGKYEPAFWHFLSVACLQPGDEEAWVNVIKCALNYDATLLAVVLHLALFHCGRGPYDLLRADLVSAGSMAVLPDLDSAVRDILSTITSAQPQSLAIRIFDGHDFRHIFDIPAT